MSIKAWVAAAAKQKMVLQDVDLGPLGSEDVEVAVEHCGLCHSDVSVLNNEWGISQYPAILGHEVIGRITAIGPSAKGLQVGQRVGVGWNSGSCMHCHQCMSGSHHLCPQVKVEGGLMRCTDAEMTLLLKQLRKARDEVIRSKMMMEAVASNEEDGATVAELEHMIIHLDVHIDAIVKS